MRIAQIAPLYESVPPKFYGGTERIVHYLTEELVKKGHDVTLFATGDSKTRARLIANVPEGLRLDKSCVDPIAHHIVQIQEVIERADEFDIIHFHTDYLHFPFSQKINVPIVTTLHGRLDLPDLQSLYKKFPLQQVISISYSQKKPLMIANWVGTVHHGLPCQLHKMGTGKGNYLAFLGRVSPEKGIEDAIKIAIKTNQKIKIAAKIDKADLEYFERNVKSLLNHPLVEFIGEICDSEKTKFLGDARALLFPIKWEEPFGLVMIESMACGTPVIAYNSGSVPEVIENGKTGFIVDSFDDAVQAVPKAENLSRQKVRAAFEERFTASRMADDYLHLFSSLINQPERDDHVKVLNPLTVYPKMTNII